MNKRYYAIEYRNQYNPEWTRARQVFLNGEGIPLIFSIRVANLAIRSMSVIWDKTTEWRVVEVTERIAYTIRNKEFKKK